MLTNDELLALDQLLLRARAAAALDPSVSREILPGDIVQLRPGVCPHWETSFLLVTQVRDDGRVRGIVLRPHRSGTREAWLSYSRPELARVGTSPYPAPAGAVCRICYEPPCPRCLKRD